MKKILLLLVCLMMIGIQSMIADPAILALHHNGVATFYYDYQFNDAQEAAVEGDTIYLSEGFFAGVMTIRKPIHIIGSGQNTIITGEVRISIQAQPDSVGYLMENVYAMNGITIRDIGVDVINNLKLRKVRATTFSSFHQLENAYIVNCYFQSMDVEKLINSSIIGSKIGGLANGASGANAAMFINCNVSHWAGGHTAYFKNCILYCEWLEGIAEKSLCAVHNLGNGVKIDCYDYAAENIFDVNLECTIPQSELSQYLGTDGTVVGCYGGETPFTLTPNTPRVLEKTVTLDKENKTLKVDIKVGN